MSAERETPTPRRAGAILCAAASLLVLLSSLYLFAAKGVGGAVVLLFIVGLGLLAAAVKSIGRR